MTKNVKLLVSLIPALLCSIPAGYIREDWIFAAVSFMVTYIYIYFAMTAFTLLESVKSHFIVGACATIVYTMYFNISMRPNTDMSLMLWATVALCAIVTILTYLPKTVLSQLRKLLKTGCTICIGFSVCFYLSFGPAINKTYDAVLETDIAEVVEYENIMSAGRYLPPASKLMTLEVMQLITLATYAANMLSWYASEGLPDERPTTEIIEPFLTSELPPRYLITSDMVGIVDGVVMGGVTDEEGMSNLFMRLSQVMTELSIFAVIDVIGYLALLGGLLSIVTDRVIRPLWRHMRSKKSCIVE